MPHTRRFLIIASFMMALAISIGAFGAHGLKAHVDEALLAIYQTGVQYHFYNTLGLFAIALMTSLYPNAKKLVLAGYLIFVGTLVFSCSLYALVLLKASYLGAITPIGGTLMIIGWVIAGFSLIKATK